MILMNFGGLNTKGPNDIRTYNNIHPYCTYLEGKDEFVVHTNGPFWLALHNILRLIVCVY